MYFLSTKKDELKVFSHLNATKVVMSSLVGGHRQVCDISQGTLKWSEKKLRSKFLSQTEVETKGLKVEINTFPQWTLQLSRSNCYRKVWNIMVSKFIPAYIVRK